MQDRSERTRRKLVHAGAEMFHRNGYANATLGEIAAFAGVTKGALYFHFASKDELAEAVQRRGCELLHESVRELRASGLSPLQTLISTTHWLALNLREEPAIPASFRITKECAGLPALATDFHRIWLAEVCGLLRQARDAGELRAEGRWESIESLVAAASCGIESLAGTGMPYAELQRRVAGVWSLLLPCLVPEGAEKNFRVGMPGTDPAPRLVGDALVGAPDEPTARRSRPVFSGSTA
ncbi:ScbR family autoregulator-binding transcription factor [Streptomyces sp. NPDC048550]|nr:MULTISPECIES: ScbR family autoregulator-binding transcription factor [unclassified Streptomyces]MCX5151568.1 ScbR family autoregulator-binding transcription factor [Streptomyces sp. NBC_00320]WSN54015.1 ScbR family autoregulator-binding transcription factor [Streptomyces sp. NBC_01296]WSW64349.1 TetR/AcrR family transcriptional regulator [Streptomyces sp. NBC_00998]